MDIRWLQVDATGRASVLDPPITSMVIEIAVVRRGRGGEEKRSM